MKFNRYIVIGSDYGVGTSIGGEGQLLPYSKHPAAFAVGADVDVVGDYVIWIFIKVATKMISSLAVSLSILFIFLSNTAVE